MPKLPFDECGKYTTPSGKKVILLNMTPELHARISAAAKAKSLTRQAYIINAINALLEKDEDKLNEFRNLVLTDLQARRPDIVEELRREVRELVPDSSKARLEN